MLHELGDIGNAFAMEFFQRRLVFKGINLAHAALHEEEYAAFGFARQVWFSWRKGISPLGPQ